MAYSFTTSVDVYRILENTYSWVKDGEATSGSATQRWKIETQTTVYSNSVTKLNFSLAQLPSNTKITKCTLQTPWVVASGSATKNAYFNIKNSDGGGEITQISCEGIPSVSYTSLPLPTSYSPGGTLLYEITYCKYVGASKSGSKTQAAQPSGGKVGGVQFGAPFTLEVEYEYTYRKLPTPQNVSLSPTYILSSSSSDLSWSAVDNGDYANSVSKYQIYRDGEEYKTTTGTETKISVSGIAGKTHTFTVEAISNVSNYNSDKSSGATLYVYGNNYSATLNLYTSINRTSANTIYLGASGRPDIIPDLDVKSADNDGYSTTSGVVMNYDSDTGIYTATITFYSGNKTTATAYVKSIDAPSKITFKGELTNNSITAKDIKYSWDAIEVNNANVKYVIGSDETTDTSYTKKISDITRGDSFSLTVTPRAYASYGGYTDGASTTSTTVYRANAISDGTITVGIKGTNDDPEVAKAYVFGETIIWWNYSPAAYGGNLDSISYSRIQNDDTSTKYDVGPEDITSNSSTYGDSVSGLSKSTLKYTITFTDEYGQTYTTGPYTIEKLDAPTVEITGITESTPNPPIQGATLHFKIQPVGASIAADMRYKIEVGYGDEFYEVQPPKEWNNDPSCAVQFNVKTAYAEGKLTTLYQALTRTDTAPLGKPILRYKLTAYDKNESLAEGVAYTTLQTDFTTKPTLTGNLAITNLDKPSLDYASSQDSIKLDGVNVVHKNFFGDTTTDHLTNLLVRNGNTTLFNRALIEANYDFSYTAKFDKNAITADTSYNYVYTVRKQYSDAITEDSKSRSFNMRRWIEPNITLVNLDWTTSNNVPTIAGRVYSSTPKWGGSDLVDNIASIDVLLYTVDDSGNETKVREYTFNSTSTPVLSGNLIGNNLYAPFQIGMTEMVDTQLTAYIIITSITGQTYVIQAPQVLVKEQGIPFAIRRHGTGVNIPKGFNPATNEPAIQITGNMDTDSVATFTNGPNRDNTDIIIQNDKGGSADTGRAHLVLNKVGSAWTLSIVFD